MYYPAEDSKLLEKWVKKKVSGRVLDVGTGSGILAFAAAENSDEVIGVDIDNESIEYAKAHNKFKNVKFLISDLFENVFGTFDWIIFNPPYLPPSKYDNGIDTTDNGVISRFLIDAKNYLKPNGGILILVSSLTEINRDFGYKWKKLDEINVGFEKLYVFELKLKMA